MSCSVIRSWTFSKLVGAFLDLAIAYVMLCGSTVAYFASKFLVRSQAPVQVSPWSWCVTRGEASNQALQRAIDYACAAGADCTPLLPNGLCYLPNTLAAHASYAFNSFYQRRARAPGSCDFGGTATVARTDPSYGSCVYPHQLSNAGGAPATAGTSTTPTGTVTPATMGSPVAGTGSPAGLLPPLTTTPDLDSPSEASSLQSHSTIIIFTFIALIFPHLIS
uniref:X8 domain-containing protein n=1 Tax=Kalanchoe fedtschenkoi TaxID=63787 RepID=A0A7N0UNC9_KALFE